MEESQKVISLLRYFVDTKQYSVVDRLAYAVSPDVAKYALYDAIRQIRSAKDRSRQAKTEKGAVECCYWEELSKEAQGGQAEAECDVGFRVTIDNKPHCCVPCPMIPGEEELNKVIERIEEDVSYAAKLAALALSYRERRSEGR